MATCTADALAAGAAQSFPVTVTPNVGATSVNTTATSTAANGELNVLPDNANNVASAATSVAYSVGSLSLSSNPTTVRNGDDTLLTAAVNNSGAPQSITLTVNTGGTYDSRLALPAGCTASGGTVTCTNAYTTGQTRSFDIAVATPATGDSMTSSATATGAGGGSKTASTTTGLYADATAFVPAGDSLSNAGTVTSTDFAVPTGSAPGLFLDLNEVSIAGQDCGATKCYEKAAEALFPSDGTYSGSDPAHPFVWDITYNIHQSCNGIGNEAAMPRKPHLLHPVELDHVDSDAEVQQLRLGRANADQRRSGVCQQGHKARRPQCQVPGRPAA